MRAIRVHEFGGPDVLRMEDVGQPEPGPEEILVRVMAAGVGPWDIAIREGRFGGALPYIPGGEFAGVVEGSSGEFADFDDGTPVYGYPALNGCYAQYVTCPVEQLAPIPSGLSMADAGTVPINAMTAEQGLTDELAVGAGDHLLITAAAGGLGHFAVQIARRLGAARVIDRIKVATFMGTDRPHVLRQAIQCCRNFGVVSIVGVYGGYVDKIPMGSAINRGLTFRMAQTPVQHYLPQLMERIQKGEIDPSFVITHRAGLEDGPDLYRTFRDKKDGCIKVVLKP